MRELTLCYYHPEGTETWTDIQQRQELDEARLETIQPASELCAGSTLNLQNPT